MLFLAVLRTSQPHRGPFHSLNLDMEDTARAHPLTAHTGRAAPGPLRGRRRRGCPPSWRVAPAAVAGEAPDFSTRAATRNPAEEPRTDEDTEIKPTRSRPPHPAGPPPLKGARYGAQPLGPGQNVQAPPRVVPPQVRGSQRAHPVNLLRPTVKDWVSKRVSAPARPAPRGRRSIYRRAASPRHPPNVAGAARGPALVAPPGGLAQAW